MGSNSTSLPVFLGQVIVPELSWPMFLPCEMETIIPTLYFVMKIKVSRWNVPNIVTTRWVRATIFVIVVILLFREARGLVSFRNSWILTLHISVVIHPEITSRNNNHLQSLPTGHLTPPVFILSSAFRASEGTVGGVTIVSTITVL